MRKLPIKEIQCRKGVENPAASGRQVLLPSRERGDDMNALYVNVGLSCDGRWCSLERLIFLRDALNTLIPDRYPNDGQVSNE